jgi:hypothetical protein
MMKLKWIKEDGHVFKQVSGRIICRCGASLASFEMREARHAAHGGGKSLACIDRQAMLFASPKAIRVGWPGWHGGNKR